MVLLRPSFVAPLRPPLRAWSRTALRCAADSTFSSQYHIEEVECHEKLEAIVTSHFATHDRWLEHHTMAEHTKSAFDEASHFVRTFHQRAGRDAGAPMPLILDSGCGTGLSTLTLARANPSLPVIGVDRSIARLSRSTHFSAAHGDDGRVDGTDAGAGEGGELSPSASATSSAASPGNLLLVRADLVSFWLMASARVSATTEGERWQVREHYVLYPNPYPKAKQVKKRWHGHPVFPKLVDLDAGSLVLRSSWRTYLDEFAAAICHAHALSAGSHSTLARYHAGALAGARERSVEAAVPSMTNFEEKYRVSHFACLLATAHWLMPRHSHEHHAAPRGTTRPRSGEWPAHIRAHSGNRRSPSLTPKLAAAYGS